MKKCLILAVLAAMTVLSCGIESAEPIRKLRPPLALTASVVSNKIQIEFWVYNNESYLTGYTIYTADSRENLFRSIAKKIPNKEGYTDKPTVWKNLYGITTATKIVFIWERDLDDTSFDPGIDYYFYVEAVSSEYNITSLPSNVTNVRFTNQTY